MAVVVEVAAMVVVVAIRIMVNMEVEEAACTLVEDLLPVEEVAPTLAEVAAILATYRGELSTDLHGHIINFIALINKKSKHYHQFK